MSLQTANTNCLEGLACPSCGHQSPLSITMPTNIHDDGDSDTEDCEWDDESPCVCPECEFFGKVSDFRNSGSADEKIEEGLKDECPSCKAQKSFFEALKASVKASVQIQADGYVETTNNEIDWEDSHRTHFECRECGLKIFGNEYELVNVLRIIQGLEPNPHIPIWKENNELIAKLSKADPQAGV